MSSPRVDGGGVPILSVPVIDRTAGVADPESTPRWWMPLASAALPGTGQMLQGQDRYVVYAALETFAWLRYAAESREGRRQRHAYRMLANRVARAEFSATFPRGTFDYYERMQQYVESGVFDLAGGAGRLMPERDTMTYNGAVWLLARRTFWEHPDSMPATDSPAYLNAERFYLERAVTDEFRWSWGDAPLEHDLYRRTISISNEAYRRSVQALGVVLANHVLSMVDAYVTLRLWQEQQSSGRVVGMTVTVPWSGFDRPAH